MGLELIEMWHNVFSVTHFEMYVRILMSAFVGFIIGLDRETKNKPAGIKTFMYVCVSSALLTIISIYSVEQYSSETNRTMMDPMRLAAQIVAGLGFLGAGVILKDGFQVKGLTSAAMILFVGGVGIGIGAGFYGLIVFTVFISMVVARMGNYIESNRLARSKLVQVENSVTRSDASDC
ncbi:MgtC/SapB family protein [Paenibacillus periandrae]|uniref:MgtC/SapB family protein n=1 Tax=Paenibacillus periandrae TaxID=1761741 RepID=UPI001F09699F|nr:MgtC/SapB family protein [Paenibacillus periandrae]